MKKFLIALLFSFIFLLSCADRNEKVSLKRESWRVLSVLIKTLTDLQITQSDDPDFGAIRCNQCNVFHTRAAEAVYPLAVAYKQTGDKRYLLAAKHLGNWLINQQMPDGAWQETPEKWTGTTTDQLLMLVLAFQIIKESMTAEETARWIKSIRKAADYLTFVMSPDFASINYCATTTASLAVTHKYFPNQKYYSKAKELAWQVLSKMDRDGFINAEGDRTYGVKYGVDVGYEIDMSLWGLALYAKITRDTLVESAVEKSLINHLYFVYPNGAIDGSWGIRSNKWTTYGSATADGCQILFSLFAGKDPRYRTAAIKNLHYLKGMIANGMIGYGPNYWEIFSEPPCIYPTFVRAKNLAMTIELGEQEPGNLANLPSQLSGWMRHFTTVDVVLVRSKYFMATITAYRYKELQKKYKSKYMHRPTGGSISNLWVKGHGFLQLSSQTEYHRWEPMHFPEVGEIACITPRIEFTDANGYFTNLYEYDARLMIEEGEDNVIAMVSTSGELADKNLLPGGVAYQWNHIFYDNAVEKTILLRYHDGNRAVKIVEPLVQQPGMKFELSNPNTVIIKAENLSFEFKIIQGKVRIELGKDQSRYWSVFPSIKAYPIILNVEKPEGIYKQKISYRISIID